MTTDIIIPCYNQSQFLPDAIQSVLEQTDTDWMLFIVIDASPDNSYEVAMNYRELYPKKIIVMNLHKNSGLTNARNYAIERTFHEFLLFLDSDDMIHPTFLEKTVKCLRDNPEIGVAYTDTMHIGQNTCWNHPEYSFYNLLRGNFLSYCSLIRREYFNNVGGLDLENRGGMEDYTLWLDLGAKGYYGKHIPEKLFYYRINPDGMTQSPDWNKLQYTYKCHIILRFPELYPKDWLEEAKNTMDKLPSNYMQLDRKERVKFLE